MRNPTPQQREEAQTVVKLAESGWGQENAAFRQFFPTQFIPGGTQQQHRWFNELQRVSTSPGNAVRMMRVFHRIDVTPLLGQVSCPTLILHAAADLREARSREPWPDDRDGTRSGLRLARWRLKHRIGTRVPSPIPACC